MHESPGDRKVTFQVFDPSVEVAQTERQLPHWFQPGAALFVTFRTIDSMPRQVVKRWQEELDNWLREHKLNPDSTSDAAMLEADSPAQVREFKRLRDRLWHRSLDDCHGACVFHRPELAQIVGNSLLHFEGDRYDLDSFVVMPNHVHLLVQFRPPYNLATQSESWLRFTARRINEQLGRRGAFWQPEPFDHLVRSPEQFEYLRKYIAENPRRANLRNGEFLYWCRRES